MADSGLSFISFMYFGVDKVKHRYTTNSTTNIITDREIVKIIGTHGENESDSRSSVNFCEVVDKAAMFSGTMTEVKNSLWEVDESLM